MFKLAQTFANCFLGRMEREKSRSLVLLSGVSQFGARAELFRTTKKKKDSHFVPNTVNKLSAKGIWNNYLKVSVWRGANVSLWSWQGKLRPCFSTVSRTLSSEHSMAGAWYSRAKWEELENSLSENGISRSQTWTFSRFNSFSSILCA